MLTVPKSNARDDRESTTVDPKTHKITSRLNLSGRRNRQNFTVGATLTIVETFRRPTSQATHLLIPKTDPSPTSATGRSITDQRRTPWLKQLLHNKTAGRRPRGI